MDSRDQDDRLDQMPRNREMLARLRERLNQALGEGLSRGFYGSISIVVTFADGTIQSVAQDVHRVDR